MSEEEIRKMCSNIYEGEYWQPMIDLVQSKDKEIERLNKENEELKKIQCTFLGTGCKAEIERLKKQNKGLQDDYDITNIQANYFMDLSDDLAGENERLNNIIKQQDTRNSRQRIANRKLLERNQDLVIENLKLNNIINEIEKMMKNDLECACSMNENGLFNGAIVMLEVYLDKLQELKGSDK